jgi:hypothetical protein
LAEGSIYMTHHARYGHPERMVSQADVERCIQRGEVVCDPYLTPRGDWKAEFFRFAAGEKLSVVIVIEWESQVVIVTAIPEN